jgi:hypothetical protein
MKLNSGIEHLAATIAAHLREWDPSPTHVELAIHGTDDARAIAEDIDVACQSALGARVVRGLFHQSSIGSVSGARLEDGRAVVVKAHQPERSREWLSEIVRIQCHLWCCGTFAPEVLAGPISLGRGWAIIERFVETGATADAHDRRIRGALARSLHSIVASCAPLVATTSLGSPFRAPAGTLWPTPHSKLFDFAATAPGAEWIDEVAVLARQRLSPAGRRVIGHGDWRQEHVRFVGMEPVAAFDWDSLCCHDEPALLGIAAHGFCADWSTERRRQAPALAEARAFVTEFETARGTPFTADERRLCGEAFAYACAYTARCGHAGGADERHIPGTFEHLMWTERANLLEL